MENVMALPLYGFNFKFLSWKWQGVWATIVLLSVCLVITGCGLASFIAVAEADLPVVIQMVTNITNIIAPGVSPAIQVAGGLVLAGLMIACGTPALGAVKCNPTSLVGQYQASQDATVKANLLQQIQAALSTVNSHIIDMLNLAKGLPTNISTAIITAIGLALSTVTAIISLIPATQQPAGLQKKAAHAVLDKLKASGMRVYTAKELKQQFNAAVGTHYPTAVLP